MIALTAEQINDLFDVAAGPTYRTLVIKTFLDQDDSGKWPINGRFNVTKEALKHVHKYEKPTGWRMDGLEYCIAIEDVIGLIVNEYATSETLMGNNI